MVAQTNLSPREKFRQYLADHKLRKTPERFALLDKAISLSGHFGADRLYDIMETSGYHVSRATVYSTLELLVDCGLLNRHIFDSRKTCYEVALGSHFHLVCNACGKIREIEEEQMEHIERLNLDGFQPTYCSTMVYGICADCAGQTSRHHQQQVKKSKP